MDSEQRDGVARRMAVARELVDMEIVLLLLALFSGGVLDPNGGRLVRAETGSCVDPNGHPIPCSGNAGAVSIVHGQTGTCVDPNGVRCVNRGLTRDSGGGMDPNG